MGKVGQEWRTSRHFFSRALLDRDAFGEIARFVYVPLHAHRGVIGEELQRYDGHGGREQRRHGRYAQSEIARRRHFVVCGHGDDAPASRSHGGGGKKRLVFQCGIGMHQNDGRALGADDDMAAAAGLEMAAGSRLKRIVEKLTRNKYMGALVGLIVTMIIQSSSSTTVLVVGFVNAGLMTLAQATGVIIGANIGTTVTGLLIAIKLNSLAPIAIFLGVVMIMFCKKNNHKHIGQIVCQTMQISVSSSLKENRC